VAGSVPRQRNRRFEVRKIGKLKPRLEGAMIRVDDVIQLQTQTVDQWHQGPVNNPYVGFEKTVCQQHSYNFLLWHEEDIARSLEVSDVEIARVKRLIDGYNQQRNDWIEKVDDELTSMVESIPVVVADDAPMNTETPGSTIDRLSILALRLYHLQEQLDRKDVSTDHVESVRRKIAICLLQQNDLKHSLEQLLDDIFAGRKRHRTYRQFKMYNDPALNPYLYKTNTQAADAIPASDDVASATT